MGEARASRASGQRRSYHFRIEETMGFNDLPGMRKRYWRTDHPDAEYADFLKVRWMSVADGDDGHAVCRDGRTHSNVAPCLAIIPGSLVPRSRRMERGFRRRSRRPL